MLSTIQPDTIISSTVIKPTRRLSDFVTGLSSRRLAMMTNTMSSCSRGSLDGKKRVRFCSVIKEEHRYPAATSVVPEEELWYSLKDLQLVAGEDVDILRYQAAYREVYGEAPPSSSDDSELPEPRGLETYINDQTVLRRRSVQRYVHNVIQKSQQGSMFATKKLQSTSSKNEQEDHIMRYSHQATAAAKDVAYRLAMEDEIEARRIYLEEGTVQTSAAFAAKSAESIKAKAAMAAASARRKEDGPRRSVTAKSA